MIERYRFSRTEALRREYIHTARRQRQASLAALLCIAFDEYHQMCLNRVCSEGDTTYSEAEMMAGLFGEMFQMDISADAFLPDERKADEAIGHYRKYAEYRKMMPSLGYDEGDLDAFCKQVEHAAWRLGLIPFYAFNSVGYVYAMRGVYDYLCGSVTKEQMQRMLVIFYPPDLRKMDDGEVRRFAKMMFRAVREFQDIADKRKERKAGKI